MKAWKVTEPGWQDMVNIIAAPKQGQAKYHVHKQKIEVGLPSSFTNFRALRIPKFDTADGDSEIRTLGWKDSQDSFGCMSSRQGNED